MTDLNTKADIYAAERSNDLIAKAIAQAYVDGYRDGYKDCEAERPVILNDNGSEYIDLGLPSGTLWVSDFERDEKWRAYVPHETALQLSIPTKEQVKELFDYCMWKEIKDNHPRRFVCVGPNSNSLVFYETGYRIPKPVDKIEESHWQVWFWMRVGNDIEGKHAAHVEIRGKEIIKEFKCFSPGLLLPLRLIKVKG